jgi:uncharacterized protein YecA (UPF0149 family)
VRKVSHTESNKQEKRKDIRHHTEEFRRQEGVTSHLQIPMQIGIHARNTALHLTPHSRSAEQQIADQQTVDSKQQIVDSKQQIVDSKQQIVDSKQQIVDSKQQIVDSKQQIVDSKQQIVDSKQQIVDSKQQISRL